MEIFAFFVILLISVYVTEISFYVMEKLLFRIVHFFGRK